MVKREREEEARIGKKNKVEKKKNGKEKKKKIRTEEE